jgi:hypothetical protein
VERLTPSIEKEWPAEKEKKAPEKVPEKIVLPPPKTEDRYAGFDEFVELYKEKTVIESGKGSNLKNRLGKRSLLCGNRFCSDIARSGLVGVQTGLSIFIDISALVLEDQDDLLMVFLEEGAHEVGALLLADIAHISGLVAPGFTHSHSPTQILLQAQRTKHCVGLAVDLSCARNRMQKK